MKYTFNHMACKLMEHGIPMEVVKTLPDMELTAIMNKPCLNIFALDDYFHSKYGNYEDENKSLQDIFKELFENDWEEIKSYFLGE